MPWQDYQGLLHAATWPNILGGRVAALQHARRRFSAAFARCNMAKKVGKACSDPTTWPPRIFGAFCTLQHAQKSWEGMLQFAKAGGAIFSDFYLSSFTFDLVLPFRL
jgi:hypothetical protein